MADPTSRIVISIFAPSFDGQFWGRYPQGDKPSSGAEFAAGAVAQVNSSASLSTAVRLAAIAQGVAGGNAAMSSGIRLAADAAARVSVGASLDDPDTGLADLNARRTEGGVVWSHAWESDAEVNAFRWTSAFGNDPNAIGNANSHRVRREAGTGPNGGGCLVFTKLVGTTELGTHWWRPNAPIVGSGNGRGVDDPGASGTIPAQAYAPTSGGSQIANWGNRSFYGDVSHHTAGVFDGEEYWLQIQVKADPRRAVAGQPSGGKLFYQTRTDSSFTSQEIVTYSGGLNSNHPGKNFLRAYGPGSTDPMEGQGAANYPGPQANSELGVCILGQVPNNCWAYSEDWDTLLIHNVPGPDGNEHGRYRVYAQHAGEKGYTRIWDQPSLLYNYGAGRPFGYNATLLSSYHNGNQGISTNTEFDHRFGPVIFSKRFIAPVGSLQTELGEACLALPEGQSATFTPGTQHDLANPPSTVDGPATASQRLDWQARFFHDAVHNVLHLLAKSASGQGGPTDWRHRVYDIKAGVWLNRDFNFNRNGHIYAACDIDPYTGHLYSAFSAGNPQNDLWRWRFDSQTWEQLAADYRAGGNTNPPPGLAFHPNLFRRGHGGPIICSANSGHNFGLSYWNERTGASTFQATGLQLANGVTPSTSPQGAYFAWIDRVLMGRERHCAVGPGPNVVDMGLPPIRTMGTAAQTSCGVLLQHPGNPRKMILLEKSGTNRWWDTEDGQNYTLRGTHPLPNSAGNPITMCSLGNNYGCVLGIGENGGPLTSIAWKVPV